MRRLLWCAAITFTACAHHTGSSVPDLMVVKNQPVPPIALPARASDFDAPPGVVVLHYYGSGGWLVQWRDTVVLATPYFSNHSLASLLASNAMGARLEAKLDAVRAGTRDTPIGKTKLMLIGHGHVDHSGDVQALFDAGLITGKPALMADRSTTNQLAALKDHFGCVGPVDYWEPEEAAKKCPVPFVRVTPFPNAHAPHLQIAGLDVAAYAGVVKEPATAAPQLAPDFKLGIPWGYLIDLLDERGRVAFRIHYVDSVGTPPHAIIPRPLLAERDVDLHIACVPGFEQADFYPDAVLAYHHVRYVLLGHWEDFFVPRTELLRPLRNVLDVPALERFIDAVQRDLPHANGVVPLDGCGAGRQCGPRGEAWALPVPGETYRFATSTPR